MKLYGYFRSSAAYRVRIALNLKGLAPEHAFVHLRKGEQQAAAYAALNPQKFVPALETDDGALLTQSLAIVEYLDEVHPHPALLPADPADRARVRAIALAVACDIHPLNNLRVLKHLGKALGLDEEARNAWYRHWIAEGFDALEAMLANDPRTGRFCHGDQPTLADVFLVPQVSNAERFDCDLTPYPTVVRIAAAARALPAFADAAPERQPDAE
ncbi:maleylacetoacetate isomerase [Azospirillum sp. TSO22-1]|uniref:maleylacetoacetate isomerase n=1 Tax=Azospirillum sp. TSO22-1 TaxID=716789 RepID=UPI000D61C98A|nr:maleylacetoacetate isomerase [Azospirillum sp. TSO22-1]PWC56616.1 maleylacetoacetate isomerase [Azospirillum sp. TSO22-1]